jgi:predicted GTPase
VRAASPVRLDDPAAVRGRKVVVVEDGPTITHGSMPWGAGFVAANAVAASEVVDPRPAAAGSLREVYARYPHIGPVLPAVGYDAEQLEALRETIERVPADLVVAATPVDLARLIPLKKRVIRARYEFAETSGPSLGAIVDAWVQRALQAR